MIARYFYCFWIYGLRNFFGFYEGKLIE